MDETEDKEPGKDKDYTESHDIYTFGRLIHHFSLAKFQARLQKRFGHSTRIETFLRITDDLPRSEHKVVQKFKDINTLLHHVNYMAAVHSAENPIPIAEFDYYYSSLGWIRILVNEIFEDKTWLQALQKNAQVEGAYCMLTFPPLLTVFGSQNVNWINLLLIAFPFERFLKKVCILPNAISTLLNWAYSPRLYQGYLEGRNLSLHSIESGPRNISLPPSQKWYDIGKRILEGSDLRRLQESKLPGSRMSRSWDEKESTPATVHCEYVLTCHILRQSHSGTRSLSYIGVSKLSCLACWKLLGALCKNGAKFHTRGSHGKAYFPWKYPDLELEETGLDKEAISAISKTFHDDISSTYENRFRHQVLSSAFLDGFTGTANSNEENLVDLSALLAKMHEITSRKGNDGSKGEGLS